MRKFLKFLCACVVIGAFAAPAGAKTFRWAFQGDAGMMDPYGLNESLTIGFLSNIYEGLVRRDRDMRIAPALAVKWEAVAPDVWRFHLREGVRFHDGAPFTADDVAFSFQRVRKPGSDLRAMVATIREVRVVDGHTIDLVTDGPDPILPGELENFFIMSRAWAQAHDATDPVDVRKGVENYAARHADGTGPFRLATREPDVRTELEANPDWWDTREHNVDRAIFTPVGADATRVAAFLSGELDMAYPIPLQDIHRVNGAPGLKVLTGPELRTIFLGMDQMRDELLESSVKGANPFRDRRVRLAFYQAIDEAAIARKIMRGAATPTALMVAPGVNGFDASLNQRFPHDTDRARELLAEAGYGDGFEVGMDCPNDRYVNDEAICQAVAAQLARIEVTVHLLAQTKSKFFAKVLSRNTSFYLLGWTPTTIDGLDPIFNLMGTPDAETGRGKFNLGSYSNPALDALIPRVLNEMDPGARLALIAEAFRIHKHDVGHIPLHQQALSWGVRDGIDLVQRPDNFFQLRWVRMR